MKEIVNKTIERKVLLNPGPATTSTRIKEALIVEDICPREKEFGELLTSVREKVKKVANAGSDYESVLLGCSGTGAIESCLSSCVDEEDGIIIIENGAYGKRMKQICDHLGIKADVIRFGWGESINWKEVDGFLKDTPKTYKSIAFVHHETTTGILNSLPKFVDISNKYQLISIVDAMSSYAGIDINLEKYKVDYLISSSNKCIQGMAGLGIVLAKIDELKRIKDFKRRSYYFDLYTNFYSQKEKKQFAFTPPVQILYALNEALDEFFEEGGGAAREEKYSKLYQIMFEGMCSMGFKPLLEDSYNSKILTTFFEPKDEHYTFDSMHDYLYQRGVTVYPGKVDTKKTFRISNIGDLNEEDVQFFLKCMRGFIKESGIKLI